MPTNALWATHNIGAANPLECGDLFAWGETAPKDNYDWETYKWCDGTSNTLTKYCSHVEYGTVDGKTELDPEDDAAYVNWGSSWRMPSKEQFEELQKFCTWRWTTINGVKGQVVKGANGNIMFLPAAGHRSDDSFYNEDAIGLYWSRTLDLDDPFLSCTLRFNSEKMRYGTFYNFSRKLGFPVRAVRVSGN